MPQFRKRPTKRAQQLRRNPTDAERRLWSRLRRRQLAGFKFSRQMGVGPFVCDFLCRERGLVVELDGGQHADQVAKDARRTAFLERRGLTVLRFWNNDVLQNTDGVLEAILRKLEELPAKFARAPLPLAGGDAESKAGPGDELLPAPRSADGVGPAAKFAPTPKPPPASGRGLS